MIFTGHYIGLQTEGVYFDRTVYFNNGSQILIDEEETAKHINQTHTHSLTGTFVRAGPGPNRHHSKYSMHMKYVSHYSNKNGQFILRNVQILCIIYITFFASAFFSFSALFLSLVLLPSPHIFLLYTYKTYITFYSFVFLLDSTHPHNISIRIRFGFFLSFFRSF